MNSLIVAVTLLGLSAGQRLGPAVPSYNQYQYTLPTATYVQPQVKYVQDVHHVEPRPRYAPIAILRSASDVNYDGSFNYDFETENGISARANGLVKNPGTKEEAQVMQGTYTYTAPDGTPITTNWVADEFGFRAEGAHLPTPPPIPEAIARSLEYIRSLPPSKEDRVYRK